MKNAARPEDREEAAKKGVEVLSKKYPRFMDLTLIQRRRFVESDGALSVKVKKLMILVTSLVNNYEPCIQIYTKESLNEGATVDEIIEACFVAVLIGGAPVAMRLYQVLDVLENTKKEVRP